MSTENEGGSSVPAAESAAAHEGATPEGVPAAPVPPVPSQAPSAPAAAPEDRAPAPAASASASASEEQRTEVLPTQAPPPVGPPSPYGPPPSALAGAASSAPAPVPAPAPSPSPYGAPQPAPPAPAPAPAYDLQKPPAAPVPPQATPSYDTPQAAQAPQPQQHYGSQAYGGAPTAAFAAEPPGPGGHPGGQPGGQPTSQPVEGGQTPSPDPFSVPAAPAYSSPNPQPGAGGPGAPGGPVWGTPMSPGSPSGDGGGKRRGFGGMVAAVLVAALLAGGIGGGIGYYAAKHNDNSGSTTVSAPSSSKALNRAPTSVAGIANKVLPSVVTIKAQNSQESDTGTGFVFDKQGHILTNNHVVAPGAASGGKLTVTFSNGNTYQASVVGRAQGYDVAVIKVENASNIKLTPLPLANSDDAAVGDATIAIGAPYGLSGTVTTGIVSAVHRPVASSDGEGSSASYMSAIQTDASINPGNSGGPLLDANGAVIGINSAIQPSGDSQPGTQGGSVGLGFAIPINQAKRVAEQLIKTGQPVYPVIGVSLDTQYNGTGAKISTDTGSAITAGGPGAKAGLKPGDVITKFDGTLIDSGETLIGEIWQHQPGDKVTMTYTRDGSTHTATVTLGSRVGDSDN